MAQPMYCDQPGCTRAGDLLQTDIATGAVTVLCREHAGGGAVSEALETGAETCANDCGLPATMHLSNSTTGETLHMCDGHFTEFVFQLAEASVTALEAAGIGPGSDTAPAADKPKGGRRRKAAEPEPTAPETEDTETH